MFSTQSQAKKPTILIIDDDTTMSDVLREWLEGKGFNAICAADGISAAVLARKHKPALLILDFTMPAASGDTVYRRFMQAEETKNLPVLFLSALNIKELEAQAPKGPRVRLMTKPADFKLLETNIRELLKLPPPTEPPKAAPFLAPPDLPPPK